MRKSWIVVSVAAILLALVVLVVSEAFAGGTTAGTTITADGSAGWTGGSDTSNSVSTTVEAAYGMQMTVTPIDQEDDAGASVVYSFTVQSIANCSDTLTYTVSGNSWVSSASHASTPLAADGTDTVTVTVDIPSDATDGEEDSFTLTIEDQNGAATEDNWPSTGNDTLSFTLTTTARAPHITIAMEDTTTATASPVYPLVKPYGEITYTITYINDGSTSASSVVLTNAIPSDTNYLLGSTTTAAHSGTITVEYHQVSTGFWVAEPGDQAGCDDIDQIRFTVDSAVGIGENGSVTFKVKIK